MRALHSRSRLRRPPAFADRGSGRSRRAARHGLFEDWYLVEDWTALGALNQAAVPDQERCSTTTLHHSPRKGPDQSMGSGSGSRAPPPDSACGWPSRSGAYPDFGARLQDLTGSRAVVWQRLMVPGAEDLKALSDPPDRVAERALRTGVVQRSHPVAQKDSRSRDPARIHRGRTIEPFRQTQEAFAPEQHFAAAERHQHLSTAQWHGFEHPVRLLGVVDDLPQQNGHS